VNEIEAKRVINLQTHMSEKECDLILPLAVFSESSGSLLNEEGIEQYCFKAITCNHPIPTVIEWIALLQGGEK